MKLIFLSLLIFCSILAIPDRTNNVQSAEEKQLSKDTTLILEFVAKDTFIQEYILSPSFRIRAREGERQLRKKKSRRIIQ